MVFWRAVRIQGCGAIAAAVMALAADLTQEVHRTKIMAMIGASIGSVICNVSMVAGADYRRLPQVFKPFFG